jgi:hypothetical protein
VQRAKPEHGFVEPSRRQAAYFYRFVKRRRK